MITLILKAFLLLQSLNEISSQCTKPDHFCTIIHSELETKTLCMGQIHSCATFDIYRKRDIICRDISLECPLCNFEDESNFEDKIDSRYIYEDGEVFHKDLTSITLTITNLQPTFIQQSVFKNIVDVQILDVSNSNIQKIVPGAFNFQARLQEINLYGNNLTTILDGTFCSLPQLKLLNLSFNAIGYIMDNSFHDTPLNFLYLSNNKLKTLNSQIFKSLTNLQYLDISFNHIKEFTVDLSNTSIETIILNNNKLQSVEIYNFLKKIDISNNNINNIDNFDIFNVSEVYIKNNELYQLERNDNVNILDVSYNFFQEINSTMLGTNLREIYIEHNLITSIPVDAFSQLHKLEKLSLSENELTVIPNSVFKNNNLLNYLDISMNELREFSYGTFDNLEALEYLNISFNKFEILLPQTFHALTNLLHFYIQGNKIQNINVHDLLKYLARLQDIGIDGNPWSCQNLIDFTHQLKLHNVQFVRGKTVAATTIYGMECSPENEIKSDSIQRDDTLLKENFESSNFFKYLDSLNNTYSNLLSRETAKTYNDSIFNKYFQELNITFDSLGKELTKIINNTAQNQINIAKENIRILEIFSQSKNNTESHLEKMINTISQNFKTDQLEMAKNNKIITESFLNKLQQENEASKQLFESIMEKVSSINSIPNEKNNLLETNFEKSSNFEKVINEKLVKINDNESPNKKNTIEVFILIFLIAIMLLLTSAVYMIFNGYKRLDNTNVSEVELGQLLRNKSQNA